MDIFVVVDVLVPAARMLLPGALRTVDLIQQKQGDSIGSKMAVKNRAIPVIFSNIGKVPPFGDAPTYFRSL